MVTVLAVLGVLVVLFVAAAVAVRDQPVLVDAPRDLPDLDLPGSRVRAEDLQRVRFGLALRGYRMAEVDEVLDRLAGELQARDEQLARTEDDLARVRERSGLVPGSGDAAMVAATAGTDDLELVAAAAGLTDPLPEVAAGSRPAPVSSRPEGPPVEHVPDSGEGGEALPAVEERPGAAPPGPVPFPEPVHVDEPVAAPTAPDAAYGVRP